MTTIEDTIAAHLNTNWDTATGNNPKPTFDIRLDVFDPDNLETDSIMVDSRTMLSRTRTGAGILREEWIVTLQARGHTTSGSTSTLKDRLEQIVNETIHIMDRFNHPIPTYHDHYARMIPYLSIPGSDEQTYATLEIFLKKEATTA